MNKPQLLINSFNDNEEDLLGGQVMKNMNRNRNQYHVSFFEPACEEHNQIDHIVPISPNFFKNILCIILTICTGSLLLFFMYWFPKLKLCLYYSVVPVEQATMAVIYGSDGEITFVE